MPRPRVEHAVVVVVVGRAGRVNHHAVMLATQRAPAKAKAPQNRAVMHAGEQLPMLAAEMLLVEVLEYPSTIRVTSEKVVAEQGVVVAAVFHIGQQFASFTMRVGGDEDQGFHHLVIPRFHRGAIRGNVLPVTRNDLVDAVRQRGPLGSAQFDAADRDRCPQRRIAAVGLLVGRVVFVFRRLTSAARPGSYTRPAQREQTA